MTDASLAALYPSATPVTTSAPTPAPIVAPTAAPSPSPAATPAPADIEAATATGDHNINPPDDADGSDTPIEIEVPRSYASVRWVGEPAATSTNDYNNFVINENSQGPLTIADPAMHQQALEAMQAAGFGMTMGRFIYDCAKSAALNPVQTDATVAEAQLRDAWGSRYDANLSAVWMLVDQAQTKWPEVRSYLAASGLGNNVGFLMAMARKATGDKQFTTTTRGSK